MTFRGVQLVGAALRLRAVTVREPLSARWWAGGWRESSRHGVLVEACRFTRSTLSIADCASLAHGNASNPFNRAYFRFLPGTLFGIASSNVLSHLSVVVRGTVAAAATFDSTRAFSIEGTFSGGSLVLDVPSCPRGSVLVAPRGAPASCVNRGAEHARS